MLNLYLQLKTSPQTCLPAILIMNLSVGVSLYLYVIVITDHTTADNEIDFPVPLCAQEIQILERILAIQASTIQCADRCQSLVDSVGILQPVYYPVNQSPD